MPINLNVERYGAQFNAFAAFAAEHKNQDWVVRIEGQGLLGANGEPRKIVAKDLDGAGNVLRFASSKAVNNDVRSLFKETVLAVCGVNSMEELPPSVLAVMKKDDYDGKGHPLTVRRITAVTNAIKTAARMDEIHPADKAEYETPTYIIGIDSEIKEKFMSFYSAKLDAFSKNGGPSKEEFDNVLSSLFAKMKGIKRRTLAELLACGKIAIPVVDGRLPEGEAFAKFDADVKTILESFKYINNYNENLYGIALATVKAANGALTPADVDFTDAEIEFYDIRDVADSLDISDLLTAKGDAKKLGQKLGEFKARIYAEFDRNFPDAQTKHSPTKLAIMKNIFMHYAIVQPNVKYAEFNGIVSELRENYGELAKEQDVRELLDLLVPSIETASNCTIAKGADE